MKNFNYFILNQIKSNPDGEPTVNRQSRLMSYRCYLKNLAMIFAVLSLSIANIGTAWGGNGDVLFNQGFGSSTEVAYFPSEDVLAAPHAIPILAILITSTAKIMAMRDRYRRQVGPNGAFSLLVPDCNATADCRFTVG